MNSQSSAAAATVLPALLLNASVTIAQTLPPQEVFRQVAPSVVVIEARERTENNGSHVIASGSGVVIPGGSKWGNKIATSCHVIDESDHISIVQGDRRGFAVLVGKDNERDLCVVHAIVPGRLPNGKNDFGNNLTLTPVQVSSSKALSIGDPVYAVGAPQGLELSLSNGLVSGFRKHRGSTYIQTTAPISNGSSGGGLFDAQGRLVGITTMYIKDGQALNFAVPAEQIASIPKADPAAQPAARKSEPERRERWWTFYEDDERSIAFDTETVVRNGSTVTIWERTRLARPRRSSSGKSFVEDMTRATYYCSSRQRSYSQFTWLDSNGDVVVIRHLESWEIKREEVMPDTIGEAKYEAACK